MKDSTRMKLYAKIGFPENARIGNAIRELENICSE
jgi:hypothetical protein